MKTFVLFFFILFNFSMFSQDLYEKYNDIQNRYEYYDSNNQLVSYKTYNDIMQRWEYHKVEQRQERRSTYQKPVSTYNPDLVHRTLAAKQERYDNNIADITNHLEQLQNQLTEYDDYEKEEKAISMFAEVITAFNNKNSMVDFSSNSTKVDVKNYFTREFNRIIKYVNNMSSKTTYSNNYPNNSTNSKTSSMNFETGFISVPIDIFLRAEPNVMSKAVYKCPKKAVVKVVDTSNEKYYKVVVDGYSGYISSALLKRKW
jgi:hypothetical protein